MTAERPRVPRLPALAALALALAAGACGDAAASAAEGGARRERAAARERLPPGLDEDAARRLAQLGYGDWSDDGVDARGLPSGVVRHEPWAAAGGTRLLTSRRQCTGVLLDAQGQELHRWTLPADFDESNGFVFPARDEGAIFALYNDRRVEKRDWRGDLLWSTAVPAHHDVFEAADGSLAVLVQELRELDVRGERLPLMDNGVAWIAPDGELRDVTWYGELFAQRIEERKLRRLRQKLELDPGLVDDEGRSALDRFHSNTVVILDQDVPGLGARGHALVSIRNLSLLAVIDLDARRVVWEWGPGELDDQHHPSLLPDGRLLIFDNGRDRGWSRLLELDPATRTVLWEQRALEGRPFFTKIRGSVERLPGGNSLVVVSNSGRVAEATPDGRIVWEWLHPDLDPESGARSVVYRLPFRPDGWPPAPPAR